MSCFCGNQIIEDNTCCHDHQLVYDNIKDPVVFYKLAIEAAEAQNDIAWYEQDDIMYRLDIIFWDKKYMKTGKKLPVNVREFKDGNDMKFVL